MSKTINKFAPRTFNRIDANNDGVITRNEVKKHLGNVGVGGGFFGIIHNKASGKFMDTFDANKDGKVTYGEFKKKASSLLPDSVKDSSGRIDRKKGYEAFKAIDTNKDGKLSKKELKKAILKSLPKGTSFKGTIADIGAKVGLNALDANGDGKISKKEFEGALNYADKHLKS